MRKSAILPIILIIVALVGLASTALLVSPRLQEKLNKTSQRGNLLFFFPFESGQKESQSTTTTSETTTSTAPVELTDEEYAVYSALISRELEAYVHYAPFNTGPIPISIFVGDRTVAFSDVNMEYLERDSKRANLSSEVFLDFVSKFNGAALSLNASRFPSGTPNVTLFDARELRKFTDACLSRARDGCARLNPPGGPVDEVEYRACMYRYYYEKYPKSGYSEPMYFSKIGFNTNRTEALLVGDTTDYFLRKENSTWTVVLTIQRVMF